MVEIGKISVALKLRADSATQTAAAAEEAMATEERTTQARKPSASTSTTFDASRSDETKPKPPNAPEPKVRKRVKDGADRKDGNNARGSGPHDHARGSDKEHSGGAAESKRGSRKRARAENRDRHIERLQERRERNLHAMSQAGTPRAIKEEFGEIVKRLDRRIENQTAIDMMVEIADEAGVDEEIVEAMNSERVGVVKDDKIDSPMAYSGAKDVSMIKDSVMDEIKENLEGFGPAIDLKSRTVSDIEAIKESDGYRDFADAVSGLAHEVVHDHQHESGEADESWVSLAKLAANLQPRIPLAAKVGEDPAVIAESINETLYAKYLKQQEYQEYKAKDEVQAQMGIVPRNGFITYETPIAEPALPPQLLRLEPALAAAAGAAQVDPEQLEPLPKSEAVENMLDIIPDSAEASFVAQTGLLDPSINGYIGASLPGYRNGGEDNAGYRNGTEDNPGYRNGVEDNPGYRNGAEDNPGYRNGAEDNPGYRNGAAENPGYRNGGEDNPGYRNGAEENPGYRNGAEENPGYRNGGELNA